MVEFALGTAMRQGEILRLIWRHVNFDQATAYLPQTKNGDELSDLNYSKLDKPLFSPRRLGHANLWVSDFERAYDYYRNVIGFEHAYIQPDNKASFVSNGNTYHDYGLIDVRSPYAQQGQKPGLNHFALELRNEVELAEGYKRAKAAGIAFSSMQDHDVAHSLYMTDPDGNEVELYADVVADWRAARSGQIVKKKPKYVPGETSEPVAEEFFPKNPKILVADGAPVRPWKVAHVSLIARNYAEMLDFYTRVIGLQTFAGGATADFTILKGAVSQGDLVLHKGDTPGLHHVGIEMSSEAELDAAQAELKKAGIKIEATLDHEARRSLTILAMDGIRTQFFVNRAWKPEMLHGLSAETALELL